MSVVSFRGEIYFKQPGVGGARPYFASSNSLFSNDKVLLSVGDGFFEAPNSDGTVTLLFSASTTAVNLLQKNFQVLSAGASSGATGIVELTSSKGTFLYSVLDGAGFVLGNGPNLSIRVMLRTAAPKSG